MDAAAALGDHAALTERERRSVGELLDDLVRELQLRLPMCVELVELDVELRRRWVQPPAGGDQVAARRRQSRGEWSTA